MQAPPSTAWPDALYDVLRGEAVRQVAYVPDAGHARLIERCRADDTIRAVPLTSEQEGVALLAGAWLGGERGVLLMQSSGVGNCVNMLAMTMECRFPLLALVTMRGQWGEFNPWQVPMGQGTPRVLAESGVIAHAVDDPARVADTVFAAARLAWQSYRAVAVLIGQRVVGFKDWSRR